MNPKAATARRLGPNPERPQTTTSSTGYATDWRDDWMPATRTTTTEPATETCWLCQGLGGFAIHEKWTAERGDGKPPLWTAHALGSAQHEVYPCPACAVTAKPSLLLPLRPMTDEEAAEFERKWSATTPARASQAATATNGSGDDAGDAHNPHGAAAGHTALRGQLRVLLEHMHLHEYDPDDYDAQADAIKVMVDAHVERAIRAEREFLAAMLHERAQQSRTLTHRAALGIASRLVAPDITPEDIERAIRDGNFVVCDIPDDPARGDQ